MKKLKFAYLSSDNPLDKKIWSGTHYSIYKKLLELGEVEILGPYQPPIRLLFAKILNQLSLRIFTKRFNYRHSIFLSKGYAKYFNNKLQGKEFDFIIAPAASCELAFIETGIPIIYVTDGTFAGCINYHDVLMNLSKKSILEGNLIEQKAISKSSRVIVSSQWAADSVISDYKYDRIKLKTISFGANFEKLPVAGEINFSLPEKWHLLFVGVYWESKGGEIAYNCFKQLIDKGYNVELTILGCLVPEQFHHHQIKMIPFIDKNASDGFDKLYTVFKMQHFLILPTRFDCTPIVINEASAFGIPGLVANTGGVAGHLKNEINGFLIDYNDNGTGYTEIIEKFIHAPNQYLTLRKSTREYYDTNLNWNNWKDNLEIILNSFS